MKFRPALPNFGRYGWLPIFLILTSEYKVILLNFVLHVNICLIGCFLLRHPLSDHACTIIHVCYSKNS